MIRAKEGTYDLNVADQPHKKIYLTSPYYQLSDKNSDKIFTMCIQFNDNISSNNKYSFIKCSFKSSSWITRATNFF